MWKLEQKYHQEMVVVGVEAGKFRAERETVNIRQAALRLGVEHPIVNDRQYRIWRSYGVSAWPTLVLVDPEGNVRVVHPGEITLESFDPSVAQVVQEAEARGILNRAPLPFLQPERLVRSADTLAYPGKVLATDDGRLFIADSAHHRILLVGLDPGGVTGSVYQVVGRGVPELADGDYADASFHYPQGLAFDGVTLFVADAENHAIRAVDLVGGQVTTVAGTGQPAHRFNLAGPGPQTLLSSPWDLVLANGSAYVAMAGTHQVHRLNLASGEVWPYAGSGAEDLVDDGLRGSALAQPMGITTDGLRLYVACSEASAVRRIDCPPGDLVATIVGTGLFDYGDRDGPNGVVRLQHDQGIAWVDGQIYLADSYNNKIKQVNPVTSETRTLFGSETPGLRDGDSPQFWEPGGVCVAKGKLFVADTNNHAIRVADLATGQVTTLGLRF